MGVEKRFGWFMLLKAEYNKRKMTCLDRRAVTDHHKPQRILDPQRVNPTLVLFQMKYFILNVTFYVRILEKSICGVVTVKIIKHKYTLPTTPCAIKGCLQEA